MRHIKHIFIDDPEIRNVAGIINKFFTPNYQLPLIRVANAKMFIFTTKRIINLTIFTKKKKPGSL